MSDYWYYNKMFADHDQHNDHVQNYQPLKELQKSQERQNVNELKFSNISSLPSPLNAVEIALVKTLHGC